MKYTELDELARRRICKKYLPQDYKRPYPRGFSLCDWYFKNKHFSFDKYGRLVRPQKIVIMRN